MAKIFGLHRKEGEEREPDDFYATHCNAIPPLMNLLGWQEGGKLIRENSCGKGHLVAPLQLFGHQVIATDLIDRGFSVLTLDFLEPSWLDSLPYDAVIMNPPYKHAMPFIEKSLTIAPVVCAFLRLAFLESKNRKNFFETGCLKTVAVFSERIASSKNAEFKKKESSTVVYAWFIWDRSYSGRPFIQWI